MCGVSRRDMCQVLLCQRGEMHLLCVKTRHASRVTLSKRRDALRVTPLCSVKRGLGRYYQSCVAFRPVPTFSLLRVHVQHRSALEHPSFELRSVAVNSMYCSDTAASFAIVWVRKREGGTRQAGGREREGVGRGA